MFVCVFVSVWSVDRTGNEQDFIYFVRYILNTCMCPLSGHFIRYNLLVQDPWYLRRRYCVCRWWLLSAQMLFCRPWVQPVVFWGSCGFFSMISSQSVHSDLWPLTWTKHFPPHWIFSLFGTFVCDSLWWQSQQISSSWWNTQTCSPSTNNKQRSPCSASLQSLFWCWLWAPAGRFHHICMTQWVHECVSTCYSLPSQRLHDLFPNQHVANELFFFSGFQAAGFAWQEPDSSVVASALSRTEALR